MGRPKIELPKKEFESLCALQCTRAEICSWFGISEKTLEAWCKRTYGASFSPVFESKRGKGFVSLRRYQFQMAAKSPAMAIFLGKNYLGQTDKATDAAQETTEDRVGRFIDTLTQTLQQTPAPATAAADAPDDAPEESAGDGGAADGPN